MVGGTVTEFSRLGRHIETIGVRVFLYESVKHFLNVGEGRLLEHTTSEEYDFAIGVELAEMSEEIAVMAFVEGNVILAFRGVVGAEIDTDYIRME